MCRQALVSVVSVVVLTFAACGGDDPTVDALSPTTASPSPSGRASPGSPSPSATASVTAPSPLPPEPTLPPGVPAAYGADVPASRIPPDRLIPDATRVTDVWLGTTSAGDAIVVAYAKPGPDPFVQARGFVEWRRQRGATPPWRPVFGIAHTKDEGVLAIEAITGDVTGDGSDDIILVETTGGSGNCGRWRVLDLAAAAQVWSRSLCDAEVAPNQDPAGLVLTERVYEAGDPHCCPSAIRVSVLAYNPSGRFVKVSEDVTPL